MLRTVYRNIIRNCTRACFCPYVDDGCHPKAFWQSTSSNEIIREIIAQSSPATIENLPLLMQGTPVTAYVNTNMIYPEIKKNPSSIYSFLLVAGYLRCMEIIPQNDGNFMCRVSIPNKEISFVFAREIILRLNTVSAESTAVAVQQAVFEKNTNQL